MEPKIRIAIIDDHEDIRFTLAEICKHQGWSTLGAANYREALALMQENQFDLFIVDYHLPEVDGVVIVREARKRFPRAVILVLTVEEKENVARRFMDAGADDYALKPIKAVDLISRITAHLRFKTLYDKHGNVNKNISARTLEAIEAFLQTRSDGVSVEEVAESTGLSTQSAYRYLRYLVEEGRVSSRSVFDGAVGRPKSFFALAEPSGESRP